MFFSTALLNSESIVFSANRMSGQAGNSNTTTTLSGNSYIKTETIEIYADDVELSGEDYRYIKASGHISGKNLKTNMDFSCDNLSYDRITKIAELKGNVNLTDNENEVKASAQIIVYNQDREVAVLQVKINLTQKDNICSGSYAVYYKKTQLLEISGNAQVKQGEDIFRAQYITLNMETQDITLDGNVKGKVTESKEPEPETKDDGEGAEADEAAGADEKELDGEGSENTETEIEEIEEKKEEKEGSDE